MDIIAVSYKNIGPFQDKLITVNFRKGNFLVKAPIGTGKSFLFFDGPVFALYKNVERKVLNSKSNKGFVKLVFAEQGDYYLIQRDITPTKSGNESVKSRLFRIDSQIENVSLEEKLPEIINEEVDIQDVLQEKVKLEEISFKSGNELQKTLEELIPKKEVFLNTNFLMQESDNIFETTPQERVNILKNLFGLLGIDHAKDKVSEERKEVQLKLKVKKDASPYTEKLRSYISSLNSLRKDIQSSDEKELLAELFDSIGPQMEDFRMWGEEINIENFQLNDISREAFDRISAEIEKRKSSYQNLLGEIESSRSYFKQEDEKISDLENEREKKLSEQEELQKFIDSLDEKSYQSLKEQREKLLARQRETIQNVEFEKVRGYGYGEVQDIYELKSLLDSLISEGKSQRTEKENIDLQKKNFENERANILEKKKQLSLETDTKAARDMEKEIKNLEEKFNSEVENVKLQIQNLENQKAEYENSLKSMEKNIQDIDSNLEKQKQYYCDKISDNCPYIEDINQKSIDMLEKQKDEMKTEKQNLLTRFQQQDFDNKLSQLKEKSENLEENKKKIRENSEEFLPDFFGNLRKEEKELEDQLQQIGYEEKIEELNSKEKEVDNKISFLKNFFSDFDWQGFESLFTEYKELESKINELQDKIRKFEEEFEKVQQYKERKLSLDSEINSIKEQIKDAEKKKQQIQDTINAKEKELKEYPIDKLQEIQSSVSEMKEKFKDIFDLVKEYKDIQLEVKQLQQEEKVLSDLYNIFSKELMLVVLQEFLPSLENIINSLLAQIVDYEVRFKLEKKTQEKLELEIYIHDEKGIRSIKSLSGGQRVVLRLVWILAVCSMMRLKFLFLDETINNLDFSTVGRLAEMLRDFVEYQDIKFYVVTHSRQIQEMDIWDGVVDVS